jgi:hypothetical protein
LIRQAFGEESMEKSKLTETEKGETGEKAKSKACSSIYFVSRGLFTKNSPWPYSHFSIIL